MTIKEHEALKKELEDALSKVSIEKTGDSREGSSTVYAFWTDYYDMKYQNPEGETKVFKIEDVGTDDRFESFLRKEIDGLKEFGLLREDFPIMDVVTMDYLKKSWDSQVSDKKFHVQWDEIPKDHDFGTDSLSFHGRIDVDGCEKLIESLELKLKKELHPEKVSADDRFKDAEIGSRTGFYGRHFHPLSVKAIESFLQENGMDISLPSDVKIEFKKLSDKTEKEVQWASWKFDNQDLYFYEEGAAYEDEYGQKEDNSPVRINSQLVSEDTASIYKIDIETPDGSPTSVFAVQTDHWSLNNQKNRSYLDLFTEEQMKENIHLMEESKKLEKILQEAPDNEIRKKAMEIFIEDHGLDACTKVVGDMVKESHPTTSIEWLEALDCWEHLTIENFSLEMGEQPSEFLEDYKAFITDIEDKILLGEVDEKNPIVKRLYDVEEILEQRSVELELEQSHEF